MSRKCHVEIIYILGGFSIEEKSGHIIYEVRGYRRPMVVAPSEPALHRLKVQGNFHRNYALSP